MYVVVLRRHYLDFGSTDYRVIVGGELERWCQRCKTAIEPRLVDHFLNFHADPRF